MQRGFCLMFGVCCNCWHTLLFQVQFWRAKACAAKRLVGSKQPLKQNPPKALHHLSFQTSDALSAGFSTSCRANRSCPKKQWPERPRDKRG